MNNSATYKKLNLSYNQLQTLPDSIGELSRLQKLNLNYNRLTSIPKQIGKLKSLEILNLGYDENLNMSEDDNYCNCLTSLPSEIGDLESLNILYVTDNKLTSLPDQIGKLKKLEFLQLERNKIKKIPKGIGNLTNLKELSIYQNKLESLPYEITKLKNIERLWLNDNQLTAIPAELALFAESKSEDEIDISENNCIITSDDTDETRVLSLSEISMNVILKTNDLSQLLQIYKSFLDRDALPENIKADFKKICYEKIERIATEKFRSVERIRDNQRIRVSLPSI